MFQHGSTLHMWLFSSILHIMDFFIDCIILLIVYFISFFFKMGNAQSQIVALFFLAQEEYYKQGFELCVTVATLIY